MTASIIHHGHVRLLKKASKLGKVYVALTTDKEVKKHKGYFPELKYNQRKERKKHLKETGPLADLYKSMPGVRYGDDCQ